MNGHRGGRTLERDRGAVYLLRRLGIDVGRLRASRRPLCRPCLDWSERQFHLAGALGAALLDRVFALRLARRETGSRALAVTPRGASFFETLQV